MIFYLKNLIFSKGISSFTDDLTAEFAQFGSNLTQFVIEYAENEIEAKNNCFEDADLYDDSLPTKELIERIQADLIKYVEQN